jgi:hypothetical protein
MPILVALIFILVMVGFLVPISDQSVHVVRQSAIDQQVTENNQFADDAAENFRQLKINNAMGDIKRDPSSSAVGFTGMQLVQNELYKNSAYVSALSNYSGPWPVPATTMQSQLTKALGTIPNSYVRAQPVRYGDRSIQRWTLKISALRFAEWTLVDQAWLDSKFGPAGAGYSRWVARVDVETEETFWRDGVALNARVRPNPPSE